MDLLTLARLQASRRACSLSPTASCSPRVQATPRSHFKNGRCHTLCPLRAVAAYMDASLCPHVSPFASTDRTAPFRNPQPGAKLGRLKGTCRTSAKRNPRRNISPIESRDHKTFLAKYVNEVDPSVVDTFPKTASPAVVEAMRMNVANLVGNLPAQYFDVTITTIGDNLKSLMYSFLMTGYLYQNIEHHLHLKNGLERALPTSVLYDDGHAPRKAGAKFGIRSEERDGFAPGANLSGISGQATRWHYTSGPQHIDAAEYIDLLEKQVAELREKVSKKDQDADSNEIIDFLRFAPQSNIHDVRASPEVQEAMQQFLARLLGTSDAQELVKMSSSMSATELGRLLMWLLIVGYTLRNMEVRFSMEQSYSLPFVSLNDQLEDKGITGGEL